MARASVNQLNDRITIQRMTNIKTSHGYTVQTPIATLEIYANVQGYNAQMVDGILEARNNVLYKVVTRYREDIHVEDIITWRNKKLTILNEPTATTNGDKRFIIFNAEELIEESSE